MQPSRLVTDPELSPLDLAIVERLSSANRPACALLPMDTSTASLVMSDCDLQ
jgi:hypothetical protein